MFTFNANNTIISFLFFQVMHLYSTLVAYHDNYWYCLPQSILYSFSEPLAIYALGTCLPNFLHGKVIVILIIKMVVGFSKSWCCSDLQVSDQVYPLSLGLYRGYQSWAGGLYLGYRLFVLVYLLYEMRQVYLIENRSTALRLYIVLAVCYIIWFSYLPMLTLLALAVNPVKRFLVVSSVYLVFDLLINVGMVTLFCPRWANRYFQFDHYINVLSQSSNTYRSLKSYGGSDIPAPIWLRLYSYHYPTIIVSSPTVYTCK